MAHNESVRSIARELLRVVRGVRRWLYTPHTHFHCPLNFPFCPALPSSFFSLSFLFLFSLCAHHFVVLAPAIPKWRDACILRTSLQQQQKGVCFCAKSQSKRKEKTKKPPVSLFLCGFFSSTAHTITTNPSTPFHLSFVLTHSSTPYLFLCVCAIHPPTHHLHLFFFVFVFCFFVVANHFSHSLSVS